MTTQDLEKLQKRIDRLKIEKIQVERDIENIEKEWSTQKIDSLEKAKEKNQLLNSEIKKLESRETNLLTRLEIEFDWEVL
jgi:hypothetical protein